MHAGTEHTYYKNAYLVSRSTQWFNSPLRVRRTAGAPFYYATKKGRKVSRRPTASNYTSFRNSALLIDDLESLSSATCFWRRKEEGLEPATSVDASSLATQR